MMGNAMSCFDRWGKRTPDGALFVPRKVSNDPSRSPSAFTAPLSPTSPSVSTAGTAGPAKPKAAASGERPMRRRQTYSSNPNGPKSETEVSSYDEGDDFEESEEEEELTTSDVRQKKLFNYRRNLTRIVKLKTHLFNATVKVTCSKDGKEIEWYKGHSTVEGGKNKPVGSMPVEKITSVKSQADNPKGLTITVNNPAPTTYSFTFKTKEERVTWQEQLESFQKFMAMR